MLSTEECIVQHGKGHMDRLATSHMAEQRCVECDYETLKYMLYAREGVSYVTAKVRLYSVCKHCSTYLRRAQHNLGVFNNGMFTEIDIFIPAVIHARFLDGGWLKDGRERYAVVSSMSQTLRDIYCIEEETSQYGSDLNYLIMSLHTWLPTLYAAETTPHLGCFDFARSKTTRFRPYRLEDPVQLLIDKERAEQDHKRKMDELKKYHDRKIEEEANKDGEGVEDTASVKDDASAGASNQATSAAGNKPAGGVPHHDMSAGDGKDIAPTTRQTKRDKGRQRKQDRDEKKFEKLNRPADPKAELEKTKGAIKLLETRLKQEQRTRVKLEAHMKAAIAEMEAMMKRAESTEAADETHHDAVDAFNEIMAGNTTVPCVQGMTVPLAPILDDRVELKARGGELKPDGTQDGPVWDRCSPTWQQWHDMYVDEPERAAALISTVSSKVTFFEQNAANSFEAVRERMLKRGARNFTASKEVVQKLKATTKKYIETFLNPERVRSVFHDMGGIGACKPTAWSEDRYWAAITKLVEGEVPGNFKLTIKPEAGVPGKAPRGISNEGDVWQVLNSVVFKVIEMLDSVQLTFHNIKHKNLEERHESIKLVAGLVAGLIAEGDGSAWDACCGAEIQKLIELPVFTAVANIVYDMILEFTPGAKKAAKKRRKDENMTFDFYTQTSMDKATLRQKIGIGLSFVMRSSGDSGTSFLNRLVNMICWTVGLAKDPAKLMSRMAEPTPEYECLYEKDKLGRPLRRKLGCFFEGDDSLLFLCATVKGFRALIEAYWSSIGFNMKLKFIEDSSKDDDVAEFCGFHYWVEDGRITGACMPDGRRALKNCQITSSKDALKSEGSRDQIAAASAFGRMCQHSGGFAPLAHCFEAKAEEYGGWGAACGANLSLRENKDMQYKITGKFEAGAQLTPDILDDAALQQRQYFANPDTMIQLAKKSLRQDSEGLSVLAGHVGLTHADHPDLAKAYAQA